MISDAEMKELERQISHDRKLRDFMKLKGQERQDDEVLISYRKRKGNKFLDRIYRRSLRDFQRLKRMTNVVERKKNIQLKLMKVNSNRFNKSVANRIWKNSSIDLLKVLSS